MRALVSSSLVMMVCSCAPRAFDGSSSDVKVVAGKPVDATDAVVGSIVGFNVTEHDFESGLPDRFSSNYSCGAVRIGPRHIVTAAHCFWKTAFLNTSETSGHVNMTRANRLATVRFFWGPRRFAESFAYESPYVNGVPPLDRELGWKVTAIEVHPRFAEERRAGGPSYDIALVTFDGEIPQGLNVVSLEAPDRDVKADAFVVAGYGFPYDPGRAQSDGSVNQERLRRLNAQFGKPGLLRRAPGQVSKIDERARTLTLKDRGGLGGDRDLGAACHGDSGGPGFIARDNGALTVAGIVSHGAERSNCEDKGAVYTDIRRYQGWMKCTFASMGHPLPQLADDASSADCGR